MIGFWLSEESKESKQEAKTIEICDSSKNWKTNAKQVAKSPSHTYITDGLKSIKAGKR
jgi:hypothetical protein